MATSRLFFKLICTKVVDTDKLEGGGYGHVQHPLDIEKNFHASIQRRDFIWPPWAKTIVLPSSTSFTQRKILGPLLSGKWQSFLNLVLSLQELKHGSIQDRWPEPIKPSILITLLLSASGDVDIILVKHKVSHWRIVCQNYARFMMPTLKTTPQLISALHVLSFTFFSRCLRNQNDTWLELPLTSSSRLRCGVVFECHLSKTFNQIGTSIFR